MLAIYEDGPETSAAPDVLLIHGGAEDADMLTAQAEELASRGRRVLWYDRRGTGRSTRDAWPGAGADQHADDAAWVLKQRAHGPATVIGFSSGGVVALALAARHPDLVTQVVAWEPPVMTAIPTGTDVQDHIMMPVREHLAQHPTDWAGAFVEMLKGMTGGQIDPGDPAMIRSSRNAEAIVRDDAPLITQRRFRDDELPTAKVRVAIGGRPNPLLCAIAESLAASLNISLVTVPEADTHEIYVTKPSVLADWLEPD